MTLTVENGCFSYDGRHTVLSDISFCASPGEIVAILGKNGSGKTTLLKCSVGLLKWSGGHSFLDGRDVLHIKSRELWSKISYVPQAKSSFGGYTVLDSVLLGFGSSIGIFGKPQKSDVEKALSVLKRLNIENLAYKKCSDLSGGEKQMVLIARAIACDPEILILDEPESNLDFKNQITVLDVLSKLRDSGICCIFNTHFPDHALRIADRALLLGDDGRCICGKTNDIVTEENIQKTFGVNVKIAEVTSCGRTVKTIVPVSAADGFEKNPK